MTPPTKKSYSSWSRWWFFLTAFTTGGVVMALEILGSRLLAPVFGTSLFVWGALIGVVLAAMSTGYAAGGWLADRRSPGVVLTILLLGAGIWTLMLAGVGQPVVFTVSHWTGDPRLGPCLAASVLLGIPAFCLSGVLPALLRLAIADMGHLGRHTGGMIAVSTIGSLVGTWGTSFFLLTWMGSVKLVAALGVVLMVFGLFWWVWTGRTRPLVVIPVLACLGVALWVGFHPVLVQPPAIYQEDSPYQQVRVRDEKGLRFLVLDNTFHAIMWEPDPVRLALPYSQMMMAVLGLHPNPQRGLILGHGGGSLAKWLQKYWPDLSMDVVEMDPSVVKAAEEFFEYTPGDKHRVFVKDARVFLRRTEAQYDIVWVDVFARHQIPFHLTTEEFFKELRYRLSPKGVIAVNLASSDSALDRMRAEAVVSTMKTSFPHVETFSIPGPSWLRTDKGSANLIFFASTEPFDMRSQDFANTTIELLNQGKMPHEVFTFLDNSPSPQWDPGLILTDDFSPFNILLGSG
ncbi:fused MFS/spermidine synthase [Candidatus Nitronereus thalassa]|uniref:Polyamine aminopropyltransferase n=1 Tax=Candidatus Nitronereus thalassa TaxID=3020898 RepID=A0ABU3K8H0_9BACT|nr:fused MFS/spermidine synthase [Candidatus Nitronereus thalassa]MDT7042652.1 fused MFS/spermidine synthase [Candidatus Nitronereus thalassa]